MIKPGWQIISIASRFTAVFVGLVQSVVIVKLLTVGDYGLVKIATSIVAVVGVYQNLGISSGSTREISAAKDTKDAFKIFLGSVLVRYAISLPLSLILFFGADYIGAIYYERPEIVLPLKLLAIVLIIQSLQSVLNSVIQGLKLFRFLFIFQAVISFASLIIFIPLLYKFGYIGYFYANLLFNLISTLILGFYVFKLFKFDIAIPSKSELWSIFKNVFSIGIFVFLVKILYTQWQNIGPLMLAKSFNNEMIGLLGFAILVSSKITTISDAITDVTLPDNTKKYIDSKNEFKKYFLSSNSKAYILILFASVLLVLVKVEIFQIVDFIFSFLGKASITERYSSAFALMDPLVLGFWGYSHLNLLKSGLAIPTKNLKEVVYSFMVMFIGTIASYYTINIPSLLAMCIAMGIGGLAGYLSLILFMKQKLGYYALTKIDVYYSLLSIIALLAYYSNINSILISVVFVSLTIFIYNKRSSC